MGEEAGDQTKQGCIPALWNAVGYELGAAGQGCLLMMMPLVIGGLRLIREAWKWGGAVEVVMGWWVFGAFLGAIGLGHGLKLAPKRRPIGMPTKRVAIGLVVGGAAIVTWLAPVIAHATGQMAILGLGALFGLFGASWLGL